MTTQLNVIARIIPKPEHFSQARNAIRDIVEHTLAERGCLEFRLSESVSDGTLHLYEEWRDDAALASHHQQPYTKAVFAAYRDWLAE